MFETLFSYRAVHRRHEQAPLASERAVYLEGLASKGLARSTVLQRAVYCLRIAEELENWPQNHLFSEADVEKLASTWAASRVNSGQASSPKWPPMWKPISQHPIRSGRGVAVVRGKPPARHLVIHGRQGQELAESNPDPHP